MKKLYIVSDATQLLRPAARPEGGTMVVEKGRTFHVEESPFAIIRRSCHYGFASYEGRVKAVMYFLKYRQKIPVLLFEQKGIAAFPTHSPTSRECCWIISQHLHQVEDRAGGISRLWMRDGTSEDLPVSPVTVQNQYTRTLHVLQFAKQIMTYTPKDFTG
ncbi:competence protein ComK [Alkalicoccus urumqiensis]|uniref:Competence protein n=1 Tax=Alkalicoccus urumqiensis TaxID=1548213 RepID=A0A2P6ML90_ALKUR|nr:competence protein ComK [Alkalicoccus urumqiensis]PRO67048.1 hypothetical protein C6I21_00330 [Alkalicoccus urumqiensis]